MSAFPASAMSVLPLYLDQIIDGAALAFQGRCTGNRSERDSRLGLIVTYTTFQVDEVLKGFADASYTIKQIGGRMSGEVSALEFSDIAGVPMFEVGQAYLVFLNGVSSAGFSSPVGLGQGSFQVQGGPTGSQVANGRDFREMTAGRSRLALPQADQAQRDQSPGRLESIGLDDFKQIVRQHLGGVK
jgi:hypothetical protein